MLSLWRERCTLWMLCVGGCRYIIYCVGGCRFIVWVGVDILFIVCVQLCRVHESHYTMYSSVAVNTHQLHQTAKGQSTSASSIRTMTSTSRSRSHWTP